MFGGSFRSNVNVMVGSWVLGKGRTSAGELWNPVSDGAKALIVAILLARGHGNTGEETVRIRKQSNVGGDQADVSVKGFR